MSSNLGRLRKGARWWTAEVILRGFGVLVLAGSGRLAGLAHRWVTTPPPHPATLGEFAICLATALTLTSGLALTLFGPKLFEHVPIPTRSAMYWSA